MGKTIKNEESRRVVAIIDCAMTEREARLLKEAIAQALEAHRAEGDALERVCKLVNESTFMVDEGLFPYVPKYAKGNNRMRLASNRADDDVVTFAAFEGDMNYLRKFYAAYCDVASANADRLDPLAVNDWLAYQAGVCLIDSHRVLSKESSGHIDVVLHKLDEQVDKEAWKGGEA